MISTGWTFKDQLRRCDTALTAQGVAAPEEIKLHDLRHTHATILLRAGIHPKVVSERLGHASVSITLDIYSHVLPTIQREAVAGGHHGRPRLRAGSISEVSRASFGVPVVE